MNQLKERLKLHEGYRRFAYRCSMGKISGGYGRNLDDKGLSEEEASMLLDNDILEFKALLVKYGWFNMQDKVRQEALIEMAFNMGMFNLLRFKRMIQALTDKNYKLAVEEARNSLWAKQVSKARVNDVCSRLEHGVY